MSGGRATPRRVLAACQRVGTGARVDGRPRIENRGRIEIGRDLSLSSQPVPTHLVTAPGGALRIGDRVRIAHGVGIAAHAAVGIGDDTVVGPFAMILDTDFHVAGDRDARPECTPIRIGRGVQVGAHVTILRGADVGDGAVLEPGCVVSGGVPAGAHVAGVPARPVGTVAGESRAAADAVPAVVARALGLAVAPSLETACEALRGWDSLGMLNVMLSLEAAFGVELLPDDVARARQVGELVAAVERRTPAEARP